MVLLRFLFGRYVNSIGTRTVPKKVSLRDCVAASLAQRYPDACPSDAIQQLLTRLTALEDVLKIRPVHLSTAIPAITTQQSPPTNDAITPP